MLTSPGQEHRIIRRAMAMVAVPPSEWSTSRCNQQRCRHVLLKVPLIDSATAKDPIIIGWLVFDNINRIQSISLIKRVRLS